VNRIRVASVTEVPPGTGKEVVAGGRMVALFNVAGTFHAIDGVCPHQGGPLGQGTLEGNVLTCPWHGWQFDVTTGRHLLNTQVCQPRLEVGVEGDDVFVVIDESD
jgi:nitrite reductase (NADH) small subunit